MLLPDDNDLVENGSLKNNSARQEKSDRTNEKIDIIEFFPHQKYLRTIFKMVYTPIVSFGSLAEEVISLWKTGQIRIKRNRKEGKSAT